MSYRRNALALAVVAFAGFAIGQQAEAAPGASRVRVTGEIIDTWCQVSGIMGIGAGTAHHQCAIWCATGGIPIGIMGDDGKAYVLLKVEATEPVAAPTLIDMQTDKVVVDADYYERDGVNYLIVQKIVGNLGIELRNHADYGIVPFGE